jgi:hypothetical protein
MLMYGRKEMGVMTEIAKWAFMLVRTALDKPQNDCETGD